MFSKRIPPQSLNSPEILLWIQSLKRSVCPGECGSCSINLPSTACSHSEEIFCLIRGKEDTDIPLKCRADKDLTKNDSAVHEQSHRPLPRPPTTVLCETYEKSVNHQPKETAMVAMLTSKERSFNCVSPGVERRLELLKRGIPQSEALDSLREKILEQRQRRALFVTLANQGTTHIEEEILVNKVQQGAQMTRKVSRVTFSLKGQLADLTVHQLFKTKN